MSVALLKEMFERMVIAKDPAPIPTFVDGRIHRIWELTLAGLVGAPRIRELPVGRMTLSHP